MLIIREVPDDNLLKGKESFAFGTHLAILDYLTELLWMESLSESEVDAATKDLL